MKDTCSTCVYAVGYFGSHYVECHKRPPADGWPDVDHRADWCGEYERAKPSELQRRKHHK